MISSVVTERATLGTEIVWLPRRIGGIIEKQTKRSRCVIQPTPGAIDVKGLLKRVITFNNTDELFGQIRRKFGPLMQTLLDLLLRTHGLNFWQDIDEIFIAEPQPSRTTEHENSEDFTLDRAIKLVVAHAVLSTVDDMCNHVSRARRLYQSIDEDYSQVCNVKSIVCPAQGLMRALIVAVTSSHADQELETLVCREVASRLSMSENNPILVRQVRGRLEIFRNLAAEAYQIELNNRITGVWH
jgi:hypothetical protein